MRTRRRGWPNEHPKTPLASLPPPRGPQMSTVLEELTADGTSVDSGEEISARDTIRRGLAFSPELGDGFGWTLLLAAVGTAGRLVVPISMQQTLDRGINGPDGVDVSFVVTMAMLAAVAIVATGISSFF